MTLKQRVTELENNIFELMKVMQTQQEALQILTTTTKDLQKILKEMQHKQAAFTSYRQ